MYMHEHPGDTKSYSDLWAQLCRYLDEKRVRENRNAHEQKQKSTRPATPSQRQSGPEVPANAAPAANGKTRCSTFWRTGKCKYGEDCHYKHDSNLAVAKHKSPTGKRQGAGSPSGNRRGSKGSGRRTQSPTRGTSPSGKNEAKVCKYANLLLKW